MKYTEITIKTSFEAQELVADAVFDCGFDGLSIKDIQDIIKLRDERQGSWDYIDDKILNGYDNIVYIKAFVKSEAALSRLSELRIALDELKSRAQGIFVLGSLEITTAEIEGDDWINVWKQYFKPIHIGSVIICPKWIKYEPNENEKVVLMDVGMAFGTGEHETTSMCIDLMQDFDLSDSVVYDVGAGSGILGISAAKLGAKKAVLSDIDELATRASAENAELNGVTDKCEVTLNNLLDGVSAPCDVLVSNITADILVKMTENIACVVKPQGKLILSGIIEGKQDLILNEFTKVGFKALRIIHKNDWYAVSFQKERA